MTNLNSKQTEMKIQTPTLIKTAMVLVGGEGNRLAEIFPGQPTSLVPVCGKPYLYFLLQNLKNWGLEKVLLLTGKKNDHFKDYIMVGAELGLHVLCIPEEKPLGAVGAVKSAILHIPENEKEFLVLYGKLHVQLKSNDFFIQPMTDLAWQLKSVPFASQKSESTINVLNQLNGRRVGLFRIHRDFLDSVPAGQIVTFEKDYKDHPNLKVQEFESDVFDLSLANEYSELNANVVIQQAKQEGEFLPVLLSSLLFRGQLFVTDEMVATCLQMLPDLLQFQKIQTQDLFSLKHLKPTDLVFISGLSVDQIYKMAGQNNAVIVQIGDKKIDDSLVDYTLSERQLRSNLMSLRSYWEKLKPSQQFSMGQARRPCLFLDRDGVVIEWVDYPNQQSQVKIQPAVVELIRMAQKKGWWVAIISNQSGLGRGYLNWWQYEQVHQEVLRQLAAEKVWVDQVKIAPYHSSADQFQFLMGRGLRKPRAGMIHQVCMELGVDRSRSVLIGDNVTDMMAGAVAQIQHLCLLQVDRSTSVNSDNIQSGQQDEMAWRDWPLNNRTKYGIEIPKCNNIQDLTALIEPLIK